MIIVIITIAILIIGVITLRVFDTFTIDSLGLSVTILAGIALFTEGMLIGPTQYESTRAKYIALTKVIDETVDTGMVVEKKELYLDIEEYNADVRSIKRFAASYWTNWFYGPGWEELKEIEY